MVLISVTTLFFAFATFVAYDLHSMREQIADDLTIFARALGFSLTAGSDANQVLQTLKRNRHIISACLIAPDGTVRAKYIRPGVKDPKFPSEIENDGDYLQDFHIQVFYSVVQDRKNFGTIFIQSDLQDIWTRLKGYLSIFAIIILLSSLISYFLSSRFQRFISSPILELVDIERAVSIQKDYSVRAVKQGDDEIGLLIDGFNEMLSQIQLRDDELTLAKDYVSSILTSMIDSMIVLDRNGNIRTVNKALTDLVGYTEKELVGATLGKFDAEKEGSSLRASSRKEMLGKLFKHGSIRDFEMTFETIEGKKIPMSCSGSVMHNQKGEIEGLVIIAKDITQRKRTEIELHAAKEAAEEASRTKSAFLANMSHELRTPLNAIIGYSEMLQEEALDLQQDAFLPDLRKIHSAGKHLLSLINDILDLSKIEAGKMELFSETFNLDAMIHDVVTTIRPLVQKNNNSFELISQENIGTMHADVTRIKQVLFNLLSNACKFTENGKITLTISKQYENLEDWITFEVADTGIGMTPPQLSKLFQAFTQAESSTSRKYGGTGLGLVISKRISQMMGGDVSVVSEHGAGSKFTAKVPAGKPEEGRDSTLIIHNFHPRVEPKPFTSTVLVIDDDPEVRELISRFLTKEGFYVTTAATGEEGLKLARELKPSAITLDVMMPEMDGWTVLKTLKADPTLASIPVVMATIVENQKVGYALGVSEYLVKPIDYERLATILHTFKRGNENYSILTIEDDPAAREMIRRMLETQGWKVNEAENGRVALQKMEHSLPHLIILDLMMPEMDGFEFISVIRKKQEWQHIPVVVVTAKEITNSDRERLNGYVKTIFQKGTYQREELLSEIRDLLTPLVSNRFS